MSAFHFQPAIEPQRTLGKSPFRLEDIGDMPAVFGEPIAHVGQIPFVRDARFAPIGSEGLWANRPPTVLAARRRRRLPFVMATGRIITQQEIDDALDD